VDDSRFDRMLRTLEDVVDVNDERAVEAVASVVPTYHPWKKSEE
jgi:transposase